MIRMMVLLPLTEVETRIKIYKKEGYEWANQKVWYYNQD